MAKYSPKLPASSGGPGAYLVSLGDYVMGRAQKPPSRFAISRSTWQQIERAYGEPLPTDVREALVKATEFFALFEECERAGERVIDVQKTIEACKRRASEFQRALPSLESDASRVAMFFISENFNDPRLFGILHNLLPSFDVACNAALKALSEYPPIKEGDEWSTWIRKLNKIVQNNALPADVRKDAGNKSKTDKQSPFTLLVWELQSCLPVESRRHAHSPGALATAISRALGSNKLVAPSE
jgi:hypothetical protein